MLTALPRDGSLRSKREAKGLSLRATARTADIDVAHLSRAERGERQLSVEALYRVAVVLELEDVVTALTPYVTGRATAKGPVDIPVDHLGNAAEIVPDGPP